MVSTLCIRPDGAIKGKEERYDVKEAKQ